MRRTIMMRKFTIAAVVTSALAFPALAQDQKSANPSTGGPTGVITKEVPPMKGDTASPNATVPGKAMDSATPSMKPSDPVSGATVTSSSIKLTDADAKLWIGKPVYSSDQKNIGEVEAFLRSADGTVTEMHAGIGGFLGLGETHVVILPSQFTLNGDRISINVASADAKALPKVIK
jgi:hypothetical protein